LRRPVPIDCIAIDLPRRNELASWIALVMVAAVSRYGVALRNPSDIGI
jgi:hypothetical protein